MMSDRGTTHWEGCERYPGCWNEEGHHDCARALIVQLANGWLAYDSLQLGDTYERMLGLSREIVGDDNVPREVVKDE